ncbi:MAG: helix-turn-helix domain-containing protein [Clostridia bacterium]|nr:helix-turn-helix domain-containing protein [Clostridia bacterium]
MEKSVLSNNIKNLRKKHNLTQSQLAELIGKDRSLIAKYEKGIAIPPLDTLQQIAKLYNITVDTLCGNIDSETAVLKSDATDNKIFYSDLSENERELILKIRLAKEDKIDEIIGLLSDSNN